MPKAILTKPSAPVDSVVEIPGSKSYTNRALAMATLADGVSTITGFSESDDSVLLIKALREVGVQIKEYDDRIVVHGNGGKFSPLENVEVNLGHAGTSSRFFISIAALIPGTVVVDGSERLRERPVEELIEAIRTLGVEIEYLQNEGCLPVKIKGGTIKNHKVSMNGSTSSQYFTSLMLIAPVLENGIEIEVIGEQISRSYIDMTIGGMKDFGVKVRNDNYKVYSISKDENYRATKYHVEGDASGASYLLACAALSGGKVRVTNIDENSSQGDAKFARLLEQMGCKISSNASEHWIEIVGTSELQAITTDMELMPDTAQTLMVVAAFAKGTTRITGLSTLKVKESDRIEDTKMELEKLGVTVRTGPDWMEIDGGNPKVSSPIATHKDHRMAMSFAVAANHIDGLEILEPDVVNKSFPTFWEVMGEMGIGVSVTN